MLKRLVHSSGGANNIWLCLLFFTIAGCFYMLNSPLLEKHIFVNIWSKQKDKAPFTNQQSDPGETVQEERRLTLQKFCQQKQRFKPSYNKYRSYRNDFFYNDKKQFTFCRIPKVACTAWKKALLYTLGLVKSPYNVSASKVYRIKFPYLEEISNSPTQLQMRREYFSFMFSRHPFDRFFSAYRNKFMDPRHNNSGYLQAYGPRVIKALKGDIESHPKRVINGKTLFVITFEEFTRFVLYHQKTDPHWALQTKICHICDYNFNFLGHFEHLNEEANMVFRKLDIDMHLPNEIGYANKTTDMLQKYYKELPQELINKLYEHYRDDFEAFGYDRYQYFKF